MARRTPSGSCLKRIAASLTGQALLLPCILVVIWVSSDCGWP